MKCPYGTVKCGFSQTNFFWEVAFVDASISDDLSEIRRLAEDDLDGALIECYLAIQESFATKGQVIHDDTKKSLAYLLAQREK